MLSFNLMLFIVISLTGVTICNDLFTCDGLIYHGKCYWVERELLSFNAHTCHLTSIPNATFNKFIADELLIHLTNINKVYIDADTDILSFGDWTNWAPQSGSSSKRRKRRSSGTSRYCGYLDVNQYGYFWKKGNCQYEKHALCDREYYTWKAWGAWGRCSLETETRTRNRSCVEEGCNDWLQSNSMLSRTTETEACNPYGNWTEWTRWGVCPVTEVRKRWRFCIGSEYCREEDGIGRMMNETCIPEREGVLLALPGRLLNHNALVIEEVDSLVSCAVHCKSFPSTCTSVNYEPNELLCELNDKEGKINPSDLLETTDMEWVNFEFMIVEEEGEPFNRFY